MAFMSCQFPSHSRAGFSLQSWTVLVLLELWHGAISCTKIYPFFGSTTHLHNILISLIISLWYFALSMSIHFSLKRHASAADGSTVLHTYRRFYSSLNTISMIFLILFASNATKVSMAMTVNAND